MHLERSSIYSFHVGSLVAEADAPLESFPFSGASQSTPEMSSGRPKGTRQVVCFIIFRLTSHFSLFLAHLHFLSSVWTFILPVCACLSRLSEAYHVLCSLNRQYKAF